MSQSVTHKKPIKRQCPISLDKQYLFQKFCNNISSTTTSNDYDGNSESDKYYTASSGEEHDEEFDCEDDEPCIRLDSDDDDQSLSEFHIDLKTLQVVSTMLSGYSPVIQSDVRGNPIFVPPPPPPEDDYEKKRRMNYQNPSQLSVAARRSTRLASDVSYLSTIARDDDDDDDDYQSAIQELDDVLLENGSPCLLDSVSELSDVMEKMVRFTKEINEKN